MTLFGMDRVLRVRILFKERARPVELLIPWPGDAPVPTTNVLIENMLEGLLFGIDGEQIAWDDSCVELLTIKSVAGLHMQVNDGQ